MGSPAGVFTSKGEGAAMPRGAERGVVGTSAPRGKASTVVRPARRGNSRAPDGSRKNRRAQPDFLVVLGAALAALALALADFLAALTWAFAALAEVVVVLAVLVTASAGAAMRPSAAKVAIRRFMGSNSPCLRARPRRPSELGRGDSPPGFAGIKRCSCAALCGRARRG